MSHYYRGYERSACDGKVAYDTYEQARCAVEQRRHRHSAVIYRCSACKQWHYGHGKLPGRPLDTKQWKNWHWRDEAQ